MNQALFISDLHLHPNETHIFENFRKFIAWAAKNTRSLSILGDFLHVWPGDDALDAWATSIADLLAGLSRQGIEVFFMPGNRDFLIGSTFLQRANMKCLDDPSTIQLGSQTVVLSHGDAYCIEDRTHQWFRFVTRKPWFKYMFLKLPFQVRCRLVNQIRRYSQNNRQKIYESMQTIPSAMYHDIHRLKASVLIHGHTHQPGLRKHLNKFQSWREFTLSDWDENPSVLCYNRTKYRFIKILEVNK